MASESQVHPRADSTQALDRPYTRGPFTGLNPSVIRLGLVSFFADISSEMLYPLTPLFITMVLGIPPQWAGQVIGIIEGAAEMTASLLKTVAGRLSDISGRRRPFLCWGYTLSAFAKPLIGLATIWPMVLGARVTDRIGKGLRGSPRDALLADSVEPAYRGKAFGWHRAMDSAGAVLGPILTLLLVALLPGVLATAPAWVQAIRAWMPATHGAAEIGTTFRMVYLLALVPGLIGAALVLTVRDRVRPKQVHIPSIRFVALPPAFRGYLIAWGAFAIVNSSDVFLILQAKNLLTGQGTAFTLLGVPMTAFGYTATMVVLLYVFYNVLYTIASPVLGQLSDRLGRKAVMIGGLLVFALVYAGFALARQPWMLWPLFGVYGLYIAATDGVGKALAADLVPVEIRASALGLLGTVSGLATLLANIVAGVLFSQIAPWAAFAYGAIGALICALLLSRLRAASPA